MGYNVDVVDGLGLDVTPFMGRIERENLVRLIRYQFSNHSNELCLDFKKEEQILASLYRGGFITSISHLFRLCDDSGYLRYKHVLYKGSFLYCPSVWPWEMKNSWPKTRTESAQLLIKTVQRLCPSIPDREIQLKIHLFHLVI